LLDLEGITLLDLDGPHCYIWRGPFSLERLTIFVAFLASLHFFPSDKC